MTSNHIDQLKAMWDSAERDPNPRKGDLLIFRPNSKGVCEVRMSGHDRNVGTDYARILSRAPKPRPAWHDAVAVLAECRTDAPDQGRGVFINNRRGAWVDETGTHYDPTYLTDVTPLIEARVTDEMVETAREVLAQRTGQTLSGHAILVALHAALGLDPDTEENA